LGKAGDHLAGWLGHLGDAITGYEIDLAGGDGLDHSVMLDWTATGAAVRHLIGGIASQHGEGKLVLRCDASGHNALIFTFIDLSKDGVPRPITIIREMFEHGDDTSPTKYGGTGIEIALAYKFAQLLGGAIVSKTLDGGRPATVLTIPEYVAAPAQPLAA
jgi:hypothetical protein